MLLLQQLPLLLSQLASLLPLLPASPSLLSWKTRHTKKRFPRQRKQDLLIATVAEAIIIIIMGLGIIIIIIIVARNSVTHQDLNYLSPALFHRCPPLLQQPLTLTRNRLHHNHRATVVMVLKIRFRHCRHPLPLPLQRINHLRHLPLHHLIPHHPLSYNNNQLQHLHEWDSLRSCLLEGPAFHQSPLYLNNYLTNPHHHNYRHHHPPYY